MKEDFSVKVIVIGTFNPNKPQYYPKPYEDQYYLASWGGMLAKRTKERYPDIDIEVWKPEPDASVLYHRKAFEIVDCSIFPAKKFIVSRTVTLEMLLRLIQLKKKYKLVLHRHSIFDWQFNMMLPVLLPGAKFVLSHHGGVFPPQKGSKWRLKNKILDRSYRKIDSMTYLRKNLKQRIQQTNKKIRFTFLPVGADFNHFRPLDKQLCREKLDLPKNKVLGIYVGKFYRLKSVDHILNVYHRFKGRNFSVIFVGGGEQDELYESVINSGCPYWGHVNQGLLREIYSAADFYVHPAFHTEFGGFDVSLIEALACNRPVLSPQLNELDFDHSLLGVAINDKNEILEKSETMISNFGKFTMCRKSAMAHLDGTTAIIDKLYRIYTKK